MLFRSVTWLTCFPLAFATKSCLCPERLDAKAIIEPSGDQVGSISSLKVIARGLLPSGFITQSPLPLLVKMIRSPRSEERRVGKEGRIGGTAHEQSEK